MRFPLQNFLNLSISFATAAALLLVLVPAAAAQSKDDDPAGSYQATFEEVTNNCTGARMNLSKATVELRSGSGSGMSVVVPMVPVMKGTFSKGGKFNAKAPKGPTSIQGADGKFSAAGRVEGKRLQMVFVAEFYSGTKPLCTQSWKVSGSPTK